MPFYQPQDSGGAKIALTPMFTKHHHKLYHMNQSRATQYNKSNYVNEQSVLQMQEVYEIENIIPFPRHAVYHFPVKRLRR